MVTIPQSSASTITSTPSGHILFSKTLSSVLGIWLLVNHFLLSFLPSQCLSSNHHQHHRCVRFDPSALSASLFPLLIPTTNATHCVICFLGTRTMGSRPATPTSVTTGMESMTIATSNAVSGIALNTSGLGTPTMENHLPPQSQVSEKPVQDLLLSQPLLLEPASRFLK